MTDRLDVVPSTARPKRQIWVDIVRGMALLVMSVDHVEEMCGVQMLSYVTYAPVGITTAAEVFILLSGYSFGLAYLSTYRKHGFAMLYLRCGTRAFYLLVLHIFCLVVTVSLVTQLSRILRYDPSAALAGLSLDVSGEMLAKFASLSFNPKYFDILPLYIVLLAFVPTLVPLIVRSPVGGIALSASLYLAVQLLHASGLSSQLPFHTTLYYNPLAWQLLFVLGLAGAVWFERRTFAITRPALLAGVALLAILGAWYKGVRVNYLLDVVPQIGGANWRDYDVPWTDKTTLGPLRLIHVVLLATLGLSLAPRLRLRWPKRLVKTIALVGQSGAEVFVASVAIAYGAALVHGVAGGGRGLLLGLDLVSVLLLVAIGCIVAYLKAKPWNSSPGHDLEYRRHALRPSNGVDRSVTAG